LSFVGIDDQAVENCAVNARRMQSIIGRARWRLCSEDRRRSIDFVVRDWLRKKGVHIKSERKRAVTRKRP
jgi:hypothetical protein